MSEKTFEEQYKEDQQKISEYFTKTTEALEIQKSKISEFEESMKKVTKILESQKQEIDTLKEELKKYKEDNGESLDMIMAKLSKGEPLSEEEQNILSTTINASIVNNNNGEGENNTSDDKKDNSDDNGDNSDDNGDNSDDNGDNSDDNGDNSDDGDEKDKEIQNLKDEIEKLKNMIYGTQEQTQGEGAKNINDETPQPPKHYQPENKKIKNSIKKETTVGYEREFAKKLSEAF